MRGTCSVNFEIKKNVSCVHACNSTTCTRRCNVVFILVYNDAYYKCFKSVDEICIVVHGGGRGEEAHLSS